MNVSRGNEVQVGIDHGFFEGQYGEYRDRFEVIFFGVGRLWENQGRCWYMVGFRPEENIRFVNCCLFGSGGGFIVWVTRGWQANPGL